MLDRRLDAMLGQEPPPHIRGAHCRRRRADDRGCRACVLVCPTEALWTDAGGRLRLQEIDCVGCGACASACPSQAIDPAGVDGHALTVALQRAEAVTIGCRIGAAGGGGAGVTAPCLAALHPELLARLMLAYPTKPLSLDLRRCGACPIGQVRPLIEAQAAQAAAFVRRLGVEPSVRLVGGDAPAPPEPALSRRALFGLVRERTVELVAAGLVEATGSDGEALPQRAALLAAVRRRARELPGPPPELPVFGAFYVDWDVDDRCDGCAASGRGPRCVAACPAGAWRLGRADGEAVLSHDAARCTACGLCAEVCPEAALRALPAPITADAGRGAKRRFPLARCRGCHRPITVGGDGYCGNCRKRLGAAPTRT